MPDGIQAMAPRIEPGAESGAPQGFADQRVIPARSLVVGDEQPGPFEVVSVFEIAFRGRGQGPVLLAPFRQPPERAGFGEIGAGRCCAMEEEIGFEKVHQRVVQLGAIGCRSGGPQSAIMLAR